MAAGAPLGRGGLRNVAIHAGFPKGLCKAPFAYHLGFRA